jgi:5-methylcytosine-specific restriction enzyme subunit McrC
VGTSNTIQVFEHRVLKIGQGGFTAAHWKDLIKLNELHDGEYFKIIHAGIKFSSYVGIIQVRDLTIEVLPKVDNSDSDTDWRSVLISMLKECEKLSARTYGDAKVKKQNLNLLELYFDLLLSEVEGLIRRGIIKKYRQETSNISTLKGKLLVGKNIQQNLIHKERFYTSHQEYDKNHLLNQILNEALCVVQQFTRGGILADKCNRTLLGFPEVDRVQVTPETFSRITLNRKSSSYDRAIELARLILLNYSPDIKGGKEKMLAILFDMNVLWEEYVLRQLKKAAKGTDIKIKGQAQKKFWKTRSIKPDILISTPDETVVVDTKWKRITNSRPSIEDLRQMYVYNKYWGANRSILLYPQPNSVKNTSGCYYLENSQVEDEDNTCEIRFENVVENGKLNREFGTELLGALVQGTELQQLDKVNDTT